MNEKKKMALDYKIYSNKTLYIMKKKKDLKNRLRN